MADHAERGAGPAHRIRTGSWLSRRTPRGELSLRGRGFLDQDARAGAVQIYSRGADRLAVRMVSARAQEAARLLESAPCFRGVSAGALWCIGSTAGGGSGARRVRASDPGRSLSAQKLSALDENFLAASYRAKSFRRQFSSRSIGQSLSR